MHVRSRGGPRSRPAQELVLAAIGIACLAAAAGPATAGDACTALAGLDLARLPSAPTTISVARLVAATTDLPAHCQVQGFVAPQVQFEVRLPVPGPGGWNGKFLMQGCGGLCGGVQPATCDDALARHYAVAVTDMGHRGAPYQAAWAFNNLPAEIDFAYRATHVVTVAAKALVAAYYGRPATRAYFRGCSTGGRQGLVEAQRFPDDFDGIIAGAPVLNETGIAALHLIWSGRANLGVGNVPLLGEAEVQSLHAAALAACDRRDGLADSIIENPAACRFDPAAVACSGTRGTPCLAPAQVAAARRLYDGATDSTGRRLFPGGLAAGSEYEWVPNFVGRGGEPAVFDPAGPISDLYRYLIFLPDPGPGPTAREFDFDRDPQRLALMESLYNAQNPDLARFAARGGRLILYQGWDDIEVPPALVLDYFQRLRATMGGAVPTARVARLFMLPGVAHCRRGPGADTVDWLTLLENWVERGEAPDQAIAYHLLKEQDYLGLPRPRFPLPATDWDRARPVFPYPDTARFRGSGDAASPAAWVRVPGSGG
jgi:feruloyl esterase